MSRLGFNANRRMTAGTTNAIGPELEKLNTSGQSANLFKAVVIEVIADPSSLTDEEIESIAQSVNNPELAYVMPNNSVVAKVISNGAGISGKTCTILFPMYQSHFSLPVNPGEMVWVQYEDFADIGDKVGYWVTRISGQKTTEDVNYTHLDRRFDSTMNPANYGTLDKKNVNQQVIGPDFQNGGGTEDSYSIPVLKKGENPFDTILKESKVTALITPEPVPRWKKRPGDLVIQGSNNTLLSFGTDRVGPLENPNDAKGQAATIDMVVGRGRQMPKNDTEEPVGNAPRVITNSRGSLETDKAPYRRGFNKKDNVNEGNPDLDNDASRLYISMQTNGDANFKLKLNPTNSLKLPKLPTQGTFNKAFMVGKSDHIRFIARQNNDQNVKGTILLVKDGQPDANLGYFFIDDQGNIQIEGPKLYLGKATTQNEPNVLYTNYEETITKLQEQIDNLTNIVESAFKSALGNLGAPIPSLLGVGLQNLITKANNEAKATVEANTKPNQHSLKTFNEPNPNR
jgi:hypothetical protein